MQSHLHFITYRHHDGTGSPCCSITLPQFVVCPSSPLENELNSFLTLPILHQVFYGCLLAAEIRRNAFFCGIGIVLPLIRCSLGDPFRHLLGRTYAVDRCLHFSRSPFLLRFRVALYTYTSFICREESTPQLMSRSPTSDAIRSPNTFHTQ